MKKFKRVRQETGTKRLNEQQYNRRKAFWHEYPIEGMNKAKALRVYGGRINKNKPVHARTTLKFKSLYHENLSEAPLIKEIDGKTHVLVHRIAWSRGNVLETAGYIEIKDQKPG